MSFNIVLFEPEIPGNTGNIARLCAATGSVLHLIEPLGFVIDDSRLKRAGLDYWHLLTIYRYSCIEELWDKYLRANYWYVSTKGNTIYSSVKFNDEDFFVFGKETAGLPAKILADNGNNSIRLPMIANPAARSLNLSNSVAVVVYEAIRQVSPTMGEGF